MTNHFAPSNSSRKTAFLELFPPSADPVLSGAVFQEVYLQKCVLTRPVHQVTAIRHHSYEALKSTFHVRPEICLHLSSGW